ncbi:bifunctional metallophosphatase/5'-nucleotidase [Flammeovirga kamogawensis]|uniref:Metallophosphoesterase n=1 Tax=Flammeovirga kamogawensis TaxID=373891 RepID=A0ABX8GYY1_9BACT|nr:metallophosphatase [Flammeovirga kamogawensis]MBB6463919.1 5'-nucleotidase [Flammeovirga kamogawensis]QWG08317.1 metallophosphoesterase [Flammeovirga kamogawensis]TRX66613.1 bifunctional metallophosphatase/5'-nucleotidase [Flammeovirga kamogawensis]
MKHSRREFIKHMAKGSALASAGFLLPANLLFAEDTPIKLTILHTNDTHSQIDPFGSSHKKYPNMGGVSKRKALIEAIRAEEENVLLLDAGDIFQGTPYFNFFKGEIEFKAMSEMKYDAATMGNHDFDIKVDGFTNALPHANFDFIVSNYDFKNTSLDGKTKPYKIINKGGVKIGIFGVCIALDGLVAKSCYQETVYQDGIDVAQEYTRILKQEEQCDLVICLSHLGYTAFTPTDYDDKILAAKTKDIDIIIGGHSHTFLDEPDVRKNAEGKDVVVTQVGYAGIKLGRVDFYFNSSKKNKLAWSTDSFKNYPLV